MGTNIDDTHISINSLYPDSEERRRFVRLYLSSDGNQPSDADVEKLVQDAEKYALADHLFGDLWGIVSCRITTNELEEDSLPEGLMDQLLSLASKWGDTIDMKTLEMVHLSAGSLANKIYRVSWTTKDENVVRTVLVRIYGEVLVSSFNRDQEIQKFVSISMLGHGPQLLAQFPEGRIEEFIHARTLLASDLRDPEISALIAAKLREFHNLDMPGSKKATMWDTLRNFYSKARGTCTPEQAMEFRLDTTEEEITMLELELSKTYQDIRFCHCDLNHSNIMIDEETRKITLIDYEHASYNPVASDLSCHFFFMGTNIYTGTHISNSILYPDLEERRRFVRIYLSSAGHQPSDVEVDKLVQDAEKYASANHLFGGLWGIVSYYGANIEFDCLGFSRKMFELYWLKKPLVLGTTTLTPVIITRSLVVGSLTNPVLALTLFIPIIILK